MTTVNINWNSGTICKRFLTVVSVIKARYSCKPKAKEHEYLCHDNTFCCLGLSGVLRRSKIVFYS